MHRCSVHSVRKERARERLDFELHSPEDPARWKSLADMIPRRSFVDVLPEEPPAELEELSEDHPMEPDAKIMLPKPFVRHWSKHPVRSPLPSIAEAPPQPVNSYDPSFSSAVDDDDDDDDGGGGGGGDGDGDDDDDDDGDGDGDGDDGDGDDDDDDDDDEALGNSGLGSGIPTLEERSSNSRARLLDTSSHAPSTEPESKKARVDDDAFLLQCLEKTEDFYVLEFDELPTAKQKQRLMENPSLFLASKLQDCEVRLEKLKPELMMRRRWVLTW